MKTLTFLGTGASMGVPVIGCPCEVCSSSNPKNKRLRTSALIDWEGTKILIDAGPDFRAQALTHGISELDGVILTHDHYDHVGGVDELRIYYFLQKRPLPCLLSRSCYEKMERRYSHLFKEVDHGKTVAAQLKFVLVEEVEEFVGVPLKTFSYRQADTEVTGIRLGNTAYVSDIRDYSEAIFRELEGVELLVISALRDISSHLHFSVDEAVEFVQRVGAKRALFIHMAHELEHEKTNAKLPDGIELAYDGLVTEIR